MKKEEMQETEKQMEQTQAAPRSWRNVLAERNAELDLDDEAAVGGYLDESFRSFDKAEAERKGLNELLSTDSRAAGILTGLASGMDDDGQDFSLSAYLFNSYEDELRDYYEGKMSKEEAIARIKEKEAAKIKEAADAEARRKTADENLAKSDAALTQAVQKSNVDEANVSAMLDWLYGADAESEGLLHRIIRHALDADDWGRLIHAFNVEADAEAARNEGRAAMRKERTQPHRNAAAAPTYMGGTGGEDTSPKGSGNPTADHYAGMKRRFG